MPTITVRLVGGPADGRDVDLDRCDVLPTISVAVNDLGRVVVLGTAPDPDDDVAAGHGRWHTYWLWPRLDVASPVEYRTERPPRAGTAGFSASA